MPVATTPEFDAESIRRFRLHPGLELTPEDSIAIIEWLLTAFNLSDQPYEYRLPDLTKGVRSIILCAFGSPESMELLSRDQELDKLYDTDFVSCLKFIAMAPEKIRQRLLSVWWYADQFRQRSKEFDKRCRLFQRYSYVGTETHPEYGWWAGW